MTEQNQAIDVMKNHKLILHTASMCGIEKNHSIRPTISLDKL